MKTTSSAILLAAILLPGLTFADPWKDESGHVRWRHSDHHEWHGEPPAWARGRGYWDGHFKHHPAPPPWFFSPPAAELHWYAPQPYIWYEHRDWHKDQRKAYKKLRKELRKQEKKAYKDYKKWHKELRKQEKKARKRWSEWH